MATTVLKSRNEGPSDTSGSSTLHQGLRRKPFNWYLRYSEEIFSARFKLFNHEFSQHLLELSQRIDAPAKLCLKDFVLQFSRSGTPLQAIIAQNCEPFSQFVFSHLTARLGLESLVKKAGTELLGGVARYRGCFLELEMLGQFFAVGTNVPTVVNALDSCDLLVFCVLRSAMLPYSVMRPSPLSIDDPALEGADGAEAVIRRQLPLDSIETITKTILAKSPLLSAALAALDPWVRRMKLTAGPTATSAPQHVLLTTFVVFLMLLYKRSGICTVLSTTVAPHVGVAVPVCSKEQPKRSALRQIDGNADRCSRGRKARTVDAIESNSRKGSTDRAQLQAGSGFDSSVSGRRQEGSPVHNVGTAGLAAAVGLSPPSTHSCSTQTYPSVTSSSIISRRRGLTSGSPPKPELTRSPDRVPSRSISPPSRNSGSTLSATPTHCVVKSPQSTMVPPKTSVAASASHRVPKPKSQLDTRPRPSDLLKALVSKGSVRLDVGYCSSRRQAQRRTAVGCSDLLTQSSAAPDLDTPSTSTLREQNRPQMSQQISDNVPKATPHDSGIATPSRPLTLHDVLQSPQAPLPTVDAHNTDDPTPVPASTDASHQLCNDAIYPEHDSTYLDHRDMLDARFTAMQSLDSQLAAAELSVAVYCAQRGCARSFVNSDRAVNPSSSAAYTMQSPTMQTGVTNATPSDRNSHRPSPVFSPPSAGPRIPSAVAVSRDSEQESVPSCLGALLND